MAFAHELHGNTNHIKKKCLCLNKELNCFLSSPRPRQVSACITQTVNCKVKIGIPHNRSIGFARHRNGLVEATEIFPSRKTQFLAEGIDGTSNEYLLISMPMSTPWTTRNSIGLRMDLSSMPLFIIRISCIFNTYTHILPAMHKL